MWETRSIILTERLLFGCRIGPFLLSQLSAIKINFWCVWHAVDLMERYSYRSLHSSILDSIEPNYIFVISLKTLTNSFRRVNCVSLHSTFYCLVQLFLVDVIDAHLTYDTEMHLLCFSLWMRIWSKRNLTINEEVI